MGLKEKEFYDFTKARTFGRLKGRRLTKNQEFGLDQLLSNMSDMLFSVLIFSLLGSLLASRKLKDVLVTVEVGEKQFIKMKLE